jgi:hypothetical protein
VVTNLEPPTHDHDCVRRTKRGRPPEPTLAWVIPNSNPHAGHCHAGHRAEDGTISLKYKLHETDSTSYAQRTRLNVERADITLIVSQNTDPAGGTLITLEHARKTKKPHLLVTPTNLSQAPFLLRQFIEYHKVNILNVAGPRSSSSPTVYRITFDLWQTTFG